eukprot:980131-Karenia_brevis.AAC.1
MLGKADWLSSPRGYPALGPKAVIAQEEGSIGEGSALGAKGTGPGGSDEMMMVMTWQRYQAADKDVKPQ